MQIVAFRNCLKIVSIVEKEINKQLQLVIDNLDKSKKYKYKISCT